MQNGTNNVFDYLYRTLHKLYEVMKIAQNNDKFNTIKCK